MAHKSKAYVQDSILLPIREVNRVIEDLRLLLKEYEKIAPYVDPITRFALQQNVRETTKIAIFSISPYMN